MSSAVERILGYKPEEMFGKNGFSYYHPDDVSALQAAFVGLTQQEAGTTATAVSRAVHKDGSVVYLEVIGENLLEDPQIRGVVGTCRDVTERKRVEIVLRESEERLSQIVQGSQIPSFVIDKNHRVTHWNKACERLTNISAAEMVGTNKQWSIFYPKERQIMADFVVDNLPEDVLTSTYGTICRTSNLVEGAYEGLDFFPAFGDSGKWLLFTAAPLKDSNGNTVGALETFLDLTKLKRAEEQIKTSLQEKELLLQEIHHRVKNNMQVISSLLNLQSRRITDEEALAMFIDTQSRVKSMALVHEKLYQSKDIAHINFADYIRSLTTNLFQSYREKQTGIKLTTDVGAVLLDIPTAIPCGLVINELTANALKHAFPNGKKGDIHIALHLVEGDELELIVSDNGIGFPEALDFRNPETLGLQLVNSLVEVQLNGTIELDKNGGTTFKITFKNERGPKEQV
jgi:PAS domain S-box-containing protein